MCVYVHVCGMCTVCVCVWRVHRMSVCVMCDVCVHVVCVGVCMHGYVYVYMCAVCVGCVCGCGMCVGCMCGGECVCMICVCRHAVT